MPEFDLLSTIAIALTLALAGGVAARALGVSPIVGYLLAGVVISPFTPGYDADPEAIREIAELGVIFLMFGVGLHFNLGDLREVRSIAVPGAVIQVTLASALGAAIGLLFDLPWREALTLGLAVSIGSTVVLIRNVEDRGQLSSQPARIAIGWLIVQDIISILVLALLPSLEPGGHGWTDPVLAVLVAAVFVAVALVAGSRLFPMILEFVARSGSRELFILTTVVVALGIATGAQWFGLSVALGAFVAGVVVSESETSHQVAADVIPLRDAFAVLFFVSVGMLLDPAVVRDNLGLFAAVLLAVLFGNAAIAFATTAAFPYSGRTALMVGAGLAQIGEFSFIIADEGLGRDLMSNGTYNVVLATAVASITLNPLAFATIPSLERALHRTGPLWPLIDRQPLPPPPALPATGHVVVLGYGRVGELTGHALATLGIPFVTVEWNLERVRQLTASGVTALWGDAGSEEVLRKARVDSARLVVLAVADESTTLVALGNLRRLNPSVPVLVRARSGEEVSVLRALGADEVVVPEYEGGLEIMRQTLLSLGYDPEETLMFANAVRDIHYGEDRSDVHHGRS